MTQGTEKARGDDRNDESFRLLADGSIGYALFLLECDGRITAWTPGATCLLGYQPDDILGQAYARLFFRSEEVQRGEPAIELQLAAAQGLASGGRWYSRWDGTAVWGEGITSAVRDDSGTLKGFAKLVADFTSHKMSPSPRSGLPADEVSRLIDIVATCRTYLLGLIEVPSPRAVPREK